MSKLEGIKHDPRNARRHMPRNVGMIENSIQRDGFGRSILLANDGTVIAGNATIDAASSAGFEDVIVVETDGTKVIAVKRTDVAPGSEQFTRLALADNRAAELAEWDESVLAELNSEMDLSAFFGEDELGRILGKLTTEGKTDPDAVPSVPDEPTTKPGDLWLLGRHRLLCGDSTVATDVERLMGGERADMVWTDPPYNTGKQQGRTAKKWGVITNDAMGTEEFVSFLEDVGALLSVYSTGDWYVCCDYRSYVPALSAFSKGRGEVRSCIVWAKEVFGLGAGYRRQHEFIAYWGAFAGNTESDLWSIPKVHGADYQHPTQKPVELSGRALTNSSKPGDIVLDPFLGSGTTLIAAEQLNRTCYGMEIDAHYVDVCVKRWQDFTGLEATLG